MKAFLILIVSYSLLFSCRTALKKDVFYIGNYNLVKVDSFKGKIGTQYYTYKYDTFRKFQIDYYDNGKLLSKSFSYKDHLDGKHEMYDYEGKLMEEDSFSHGIRIISKSYFTADTTTKIFKNGKLIPLNHPN